MKYFKSFLPLTIGLLATALLQAQEIKTEINKQDVFKTMPPPGSTPIPGPAPAPQRKPGSNTETAAAKGSPSTVNKDEDKTTLNGTKPVILTIDPDQATKKLTAEQIKIMNGTAEKPKQLSAAQGAGDENAKPVIIPKAVIAPVKENR